MITKSDMKLAGKWYVGTLAVGALGMLLLHVHGRIEVKTDATHAVQNIEEIVFSPTGVKGDPSKEVVLKLQNGVPHLSGKVIIDENNG